MENSRNSRIEETMASYLENPSGEAREELVSELAAYVFCGLKRILAGRYPADEDARGDFILWLYPRLGRIVDRFDPKKASFPTYVSVAVRYRYIRFCSERARREEARRAAESEAARFCGGFAEGDGLPLACEPPLPCAAPPALAALARTDAARRRVARDTLLLALKSALYLSEEMEERVAAFCGIPRAELERLLERVRRDCGARLLAREELRARRRRYYIRAFACRGRLARTMADDGGKALAAERELEFCSRQEARLAAEMERMRLDPSWRYIAGLLGMPRGTANTCLARMKRRLSSLENEDSGGDA